MADEKEFIADFCKARRFSRFQEKRNFAAPLNALDVTAIAPLGCNLVTSHQSAETEAILSRVNHRNGAYVDAAFISNDPLQFLDPGPATYVDAVGGLELESSVALPFPATSVASTIDYFVSGRLWWREVNDVQTFGDNQRNSLAQGFGSLYGPRRTLLLPSGKQFNRLGGRLPYHTYVLHALMPRVSSATVPMGLTFNSSQNRYEWPSGSQGVGGIKTEAESGETWGLAVFFYEVRPALIGCSGAEVSHHILDPFASNPNGTGLDRKYCYTDLEAVTWPGYGGSITRSYSVPGSLRPQSLIYSQSVNTTGWSLTINGTSVGLGSAASLPTPQLVPFPPSVLSGAPFNQASSADLGLDTEVFTFVATGFSRTLTVGPLTFTTLDGPRHYEFLVAFLHEGP